MYCELAINAVVIPQFVLRYQQITKFYFHVILVHAIHL